MSKIFDNSGNKWIMSFYHRLKPLRLIGCLVIESKIEVSLNPVSRTENSLTLFKVKLRKKNTGIKVGGEGKSQQRKGKETRTVWRNAGGSQGWEGRHGELMASSRLKNWWQDRCGRQCKEEKQERFCSGFEASQVFLMHEAYLMWRILHHHCGWMVSCGSDF